MPDLTPLTNNTSTAQALSNLILVSPSLNQGLTSQSDNKVFVFDYEGENSVTLSSDITDHVIEDNTTIQDQIALKPVLVNTLGYVGELNDIPPPALAAAKQLADKLTLLAPFTPGLSISALEAYNTASLLYSTAASAATSGISAFNALTGGSPTQTKQQAAFSLFFGYWNARTLFTVQTPWAVFKDMALLNVRAIQDEETRMISSFEIQFKKMKFAKTVTGLDLILQGRLGAQGANLADNGTTTPTPTVPLTPSVIAASTTV